ncbi:hypothetical protein [Peribacillus frigoritolerans]|uniref:hypothetical protein n=1 Tax=Peribacillus castrilensis TaxID=2897690 RepID=UPI003DA1D145
MKTEQVTKAMRETVFTLYLEEGQIIDEVMEVFAEELEFHLDNDEIEKFNLEFEVSADENIIGIDYTRPTGEVMIDWITFDDKILVDEFDGQRYVELRLSEVHDLEVWQHVDFCTHLYNGN